MAALDGRVKFYCQSTRPPSRNFLGVDLSLSVVSEMCIGAYSFPHEGRTKGRIKRRLLDSVCSADSHSCVHLLSEIGSAKAVAPHQRVAMNPTFQKLPVWRCP